ncbi:MAG TPA: hypothetical protein VFA04_23240 [Bryobacteraceae bacterium]|nr:hypothetical protein [Bryobacteraceae bacterium]
MRRAIFVPAARLAVLSFATVLAASAQDQQYTWQIGWKSDAIRGYLAPFRAKTLDAIARLEMAHNADPALRHWLELAARAPRPVSYPIDFGETSAPDAVYLHGVYEASVAFFAQANLMDIMSSYHRLELNPILAGRNGRFDASSTVRKGVVIGAILGAQMYLIHRHPRSMRSAALANYLATAVLAGIVAHNYLLPSQKPKK